MNINLKDEGRGRTTEAVGEDDQLSEDLEGGLRGGKLLLVGRGEHNGRDQGDGALLTKVLTSGGEGGDVGLC